MKKLIKLIRKWREERQLSKHLRKLGVRRLQKGEVICADDGQYDKRWLPSQHPLPVDFVFSVDCSWCAGERVGYGIFTEHDNHFYRRLS